MAQKSNKGQDLPINEPIPISIFEVNIVNEDGPAAVQVEEYYKDGRNVYVCLIMPAMLDKMEVSPSGNLSGISPEEKELTLSKNASGVWSEEGKGETKLSKAIGTLIEIRLNAIKAEQEIKNRKDAADYLYKLKKPYGFNVIVGSKLKHAEIVGEFKHAPLSHTFLVKFDDGIRMKVWVEAESYLAYESPDGGKAFNHFKAAESDILKFRFEGDYLEDTGKKYTL